MAGEHVRMIGVGVFDDGVFGVAAKASMIAVCTENGKVWVFDLCSGALIRSLGQKGGAEGQLEGCWGLRFTPDGDHMLIAEGHPNSRLSLFTLEVDLVRCIGVKTLGKPYDVDVASNGDILVADAANRRICVLSPKDYTLLRSFGSEGDAPGKFTYPTALAVHEERVFVLDWGSARVQVFN